MWGGRDRSSVMWDRIPSMLVLKKALFEGEYCRSTPLSGDVGGKESVEDRERSILKSSGHSGNWEIELSSNLGLFGLSSNVAGERVPWV